MSMNNYNKKSTGITSYPGRAGLDLIANSTNIAIDEIGSTTTTTAKRQPSSGDHNSLLSSILKKINYTDTESTTDNNTNFESSPIILQTKSDKVLPSSQIPIISPRMNKNGGWGGHEQATTSTLQLSSSSSGKPGYYEKKFGHYSKPLESCSTSTVASPGLISSNNLVRAGTAGAEPHNHAAGATSGRYTPTTQRFGLPNVYRKDGPPRSQNKYGRGAATTTTCTGISPPSGDSTTNNGTTTTIIPPKKSSRPTYQHPFHTQSKLLFPTPLSRARTSHVIITSPMDPNSTTLSHYMISSSIPPRTPASTTNNPAKISILNVCGQVGVVPINLIFDNLKKLTKIGEGVFGEVYVGYYIKSASTVPKVYKVVPIEGDKRVNCEVQKRYFEIEPEIVISRRLNFLRKSDGANYTEGFAKLTGALVCKGSYPKSLTSAWKRYHREKGSENDLPYFKENQEYVVLESDLYGSDVECYRFKNSKQALSLLIQVAHSLGVGETGIKFEHRDLHWGNILVSSTTKSTIQYKLNGQTLTVPSVGLKSTIIDFTIASTENHDGQYIFTDLSTDEDQFNGDEDYQFEIYRMMRRTLENDWSQFTPKNNIYWLHYLADKLIKRGHYSEPTGYVHGKYMGKLRYFKSIIKSFDSCAQFALCYADEDILQIDSIDVIH